MNAILGRRPAIQDRGLQKWQMCLQCTRDFTAPTGGGTHSWEVDWWGSQGFAPVFLHETAHRSLFGILWVVDPLCKGMWKWQIVQVAMQIVPCFVCKLLMPTTVIKHTVSEQLTVLYIPCSNIMTSLPSEACTGLVRTTHCRSAVLSLTSFSPSFCWKSQEMALVELGSGGVTAASGFNLEIWRCYQGWWDQPFLEAMKPLRWRGQSYPRISAGCTRWHLGWFQNTPTSFSAAINH